MNCPLQKDHQHDGTINGNVALGQPGSLEGDADTSMGFDGATTTFLEATDESPFNFHTEDEITIEAWVFPTQGQPSAVIAAKGTDSGTRNWYLSHYFDTEPEDGEYLASQWNIGWENNLFLRFP